MAKLYFKYGAMGSSKTANAIMVRYNYEERGQNALILKPVMEKRDGRVSMSLTKAAELCCMLCPARSPLDEIRWRVLIAAVFGNKYMGFRMSLKLHRRKDDAAIGKLKAATGENPPAVSA